MSKDVINNTLLEKVCEIASLGRRNPLVATFKSMSAGWLLLLRGASFLRNREMLIFIMPNGGLFTGLPTMRNFQQVSASALITASEKSFVLVFLGFLDEKFSWPFLVVSEQGLDGLKGDKNCMVILF